MLSILLTWLSIGVPAYLVGKTAITYSYKNQANVLHSPDVYLICGIVCINEYAQIWSIFGGLGQAAMAVLIFLTILCSCYLLKKKKLNFSCIFNSISKKKWILLVIAFFSVLLWTNLIPRHYDTYLYHAQAIHWAEEYGVVKGLGNLHCRLAYNSAFMNLQALFSFSWLFGQSLHTVNGFACLLMLQYCILTFLQHGRKKLQVSDCLKLLCPVYIVTSCNVISSPGSDILAMLILFYVFIKWFEFVECCEMSALPYGFLCVLIVYAITLKLSSAGMLLLILYPAFQMLKEKNWKQIGAHLFTGIAILCPFIVRSILLSGYLVYPYYEIDLFDVDWKMPSSIAKGDRANIIAWARRTYDSARNSESVLQYFPEWFSGIDLIWKVLFPITIPAVILLLIKIILAFRKDEYAEAVGAIACIGGILFWFFSAPEPRYGSTYMFIPIAIATPLIANRLFHLKLFAKSIIPIAWGCMTAVVFLLGAIYFPFTNSIGYTGGMPLWMQSDYADRPAAITQANGFEIFIPNPEFKLDQTGYNPFPSAVSHPSEHVVLRGEGFSDGFRWEE